MRPRSRLGQRVRTHTAAQRRVEVGTGTPHSKDGEHPREGPSAPTRPGRQRRSGRIEVGSRSWQPSTRRNRAPRPTLLPRVVLWRRQARGSSRRQASTDGRRPLRRHQPKGSLLLWDRDGYEARMSESLLGGIANDAGVPCVRVHQAASKQCSRIPRQTLEVPKAQLGASPAAGRQLPRRR